MSRLYGPQNRALQNRFDSRRMADRIEEIAAQTEIDDIAFGCELLAAILEEHF